MASGGAGYYGGDRYGAYGYSFARQQPATSFMFTASLQGAASFYSPCKSAVEGLLDQLRVAVVLSPLILLLAEQYWSATGRRWRSSYSSSSLPVAPPVSGEHRPWYEQRQQPDGSAGSSANPAKSQRFRTAVREKGFVGAVEEKGLAGAEEKGGFRRRRQSAGRKMASVLKIPSGSWSARSSIRLRSAR